MAGCARSSRLGNWLLCDHARSCSFLLPSRTGCEEIAGLYAGMEAVDKQAHGARAQFLRNYLARTVLRSRVALRRELQSKVGIRAAKPSACRLGCERG